MPPNKTSRSLACSKTQRLAGRCANVAGIMGALRLIHDNKSITAIIVHKVDRLARNVFEHLMFKRELQALNVSIISVVEHFDASPMGELIEHIMAAQAEFSSANLSAEVKKGREERILRGQWNGAPPVGYLTQSGIIVIDPARGPLIRRGFELWATGTVTAKAVARQTYEQGLVSRNGNRMTVGRWCVLLQDPFYSGMMRTSIGVHPGNHAPLVSRELFNQCQAVFRRKRVRRGHVARQPFLLSGLVRCPTCPRHLTGEAHTKPSGKVYRYYRCQQPGCRYIVRAEILDEQVIHILVEKNLPARLLPSLQRAAKDEERLLSDRRTLRRHQLQRQYSELEQRLISLHRHLAERKLRVTDFGRQQTELQQCIRTTEWLLSQCDDKVTGDTSAPVEFMKFLTFNLLGADSVKKRQVIVDLVAEVSVLSDEPDVMLKAAWIRTQSDAPVTSGLGAN